MSEIELGIVSVVYFSSKTGRALYKVKNAVDGLFYALKVFSVNNNDIQSIVNEMVALNRQDQHPHLLPRFRGYHIDEQTAYVLMDWMDGMTFDSVTKRKPITSLMELQFRLAMAASLCETVSYLHKCKYWHRDLKPENVMLRDMRDPRKGVVVIDLGSASQKRQNFEGTFGYCAPEQAGQRSFNQGPWMDVFSIGQITWFLLTGSSLVLTQTDDMKGWTDHTGRLQQALPGIELPQQLESILLRAMAFEPNKRFMKVLDLKAQLQRFCR